MVLDWADLWVVPLAVSRADSRVVVTVDWWVAPLVVLRVDSTVVDWADPLVGMTVVG